MKTTVDVDRGLADEASRLLGTRSLRETVNAALADVVARDRRRRLADRVRGGSLPVPTPEELERLRRPRVPVGSLRRR